MCSDMRKKQEHLFKFVGLMAMSESANGGPCNGCSSNESGTGRDKQQYVLRKKKVCANEIRAVWCKALRWFLQLAPGSNGGMGRGWRGAGSVW